MNVFLGYPPEYVKNWINENKSSKFTCYVKCVHDDDIIDEFTFELNHGNWTEYDLKNELKKHFTIYNDMAKIIIDDIEYTSIQGFMWTEIYDHATHNQLQYWCNGEAQNDISSDIDIVVEFPDSRELTSDNPHNDPHASYC